MVTFRALSLRQQLATMRQSFKRLTASHGSRNKWADAYWPGKAFEQPTFHTPVLLFKRPKQPYFYIRDQKMGWGARSAGGVEICEIHCEHFEILRQPNVQLIAQRLSERLRQLSKPNQTTLTLPNVNVAGAVSSELANPLFE
jgi:thioesterase domain-containing protein